MDKFIGRWEVTATENLGPMIDQIGMDESMQELIKKRLPALEYNRDGDTWIMKVILPDISKEYRFKSGQELDTISIDGRPVKSITTVEDNKFVEIYHFKDASSSESKVIREIEGDELVVTMFCDGIKSVARHRKVAS